MSGKDGTILGRRPGDELASLRAGARTAGGAVPARRSADTFVFNVPDKSCGLPNRLPAKADVPKRDERGYQVGIHALRTTFGTHLAKGNAHPKIAMQFMRHGRIELTVRPYTDPRLLDRRKTPDSLPKFAGVAEGQQSVCGAMS